GRAASARPRDGGRQRGAAEPLATNEKRPRCRGFFWRGPDTARCPLLCVFRRRASDVRRVQRWRTCAAPLEGGRERHLRAVAPLDRELAGAEDVIARGCRRVEVPSQR